MTADPLPDPETAPAQHQWSWWAHEPHRLEADRRDLAGRFPDLKWTPAESGAWEGALPIWPFERERPAGVSELVGEQGLRVQVRCGQAYPIIVPAVFATAPEPTVLQRTQHRWHINSDGSLCLLADPTRWTGREPLSDLLLKAAGWHIEYALMNAGALQAMTANGIVNDTCLDTLIGNTARQGRADRS